MMDVVSLIFDAVVLVALGATIGYAVRLSRLFDKMQADRQAFESLIQSLNLAAGRAEAAIRTLKETAVGSADTVQEKINTARGLAEELEIMIQAGDSLADRLSAAAQKRAPESAAAPQGAQPRSRAEKELLEAVKNARIKD